MAPQPKKRAEKIPFSINFDGIDEMDFGKSYDIPLKVGKLHSMSVRAAVVILLAAGFRNGSTN